MYFLIYIYTYPSYISEWPGKSWKLFFLVVTPTRYHGHFAWSWWTCWFAEIAAKESNATLAKERSDRRFFCCLSDFLGGKMGKLSHLTNIFQMGWKHQLVFVAIFRYPSFFSAKIWEVATKKTPKYEGRSGIFKNQGGWFRCIYFFFWNGPFFGGHVSFTVCTLFFSAKIWRLKVGETAPSPAIFQGVFAEVKESLGFYRMCFLRG